MILADSHAVVIKYYVGSGFKSPVVEASGVDPDRFWLCLGGSDYYASEDSLDVEQATMLRDMLTAWLLSKEDA